MFNGTFRSQVKFEICRSKGDVDLKEFFFRPSPFQCTVERRLCFALVLQRRKWNYMAIFFIFLTPFCHEGVNLATSKCDDQAPRLGVPLPSRFQAARIVFFISFRGDLW